MEESKISKKGRRLICAISLSFVSLFVGLVCGIQVASKNNLNSDDEFSEITKLLKEKWVSDIYYGQDVDEDVIIDQFVGMLSTSDDRYLDSYTYLKKNEQVSEEEKVGVIGITSTNVYNYPVIVSINDASPVKGILEVGDIILSLGKDEGGAKVYYNIADKDGNFSKTFDYALGKPGDNLYIKYAHFNDDELEIKETAIQLLEKVDTAYAYTIDYPINDALIIKLTSFVDSTSSLSSANQFADILEDNEAKGENKAHNLVIDLRDNGGGDMSSAIDILDLFLEKDKLVTKVEYKQETVAYYTKDDTKYDFDHFYILQNGNTASASEILISGITYYFNDKTTLIGTKSYGKGIVQRVTSVLNNAYTLRYTCAKWLRPDDSWIGMVGSKYTDGYQLGFSPDSDNIINKNELLATLENNAGYIYYKDDSVDDYYAFTLDKISSVNSYFFKNLNLLINADARTDSYYDSSNSQAIKDYQNLKGLDENGLMDETTFLYFVKDLYDLKVDFTNSYYEKTKTLIG